MAALRKMLSVIHLKSVVFWFALALKQMQGGLKDNFHLKSTGDCAMEYQRKANSCQEVWHHSLKPAHAIPPINDKPDSKQQSKMDLSKLYLSKQGSPISDLKGLAPLQEHLPFVDFLKFGFQKINPPKINSPKLDSPQPNLLKLNSPSLHLLTLHLPQLDLPEIGSTTVDLPKLDLSKLDFPQLKSQKLVTTKLDFSDPNMLQGLQNLDTLKLSLPNSDSQNLNSRKLDSLESDSVTLDSPKSNTSKPNLPHLVLIRKNVLRLVMPTTSLRFDSRSITNFPPIVQRLFTRTATSKPRQKASKRHTDRILKTLKTRKCQTMKPPVKKPLILRPPEVIRRPPLALLIGHEQRSAKNEASSRDIEISDDENHPTTTKKRKADDKQGDNPEIDKDEDTALGLEFSKKASINRRIG